MILRLRNTTALSSLLITLAMNVPAYSSILDTDQNCRQHGCAVISYDENRYVVYDTVDQTGDDLAPGQPLLPRFSTPEFLNVTGTLTPATVPDDDHGMILGITQNGTLVNQVFSDNDLDGFLDAGDSYARPISVSGTTDIVLDDRSQSYSHSFYISSTQTEMSLRVRVAEAQFTDDFGSTLSLDDISITPTISLSGNDNGFNFGGRANGNRITIDPLINDLGDLSSSSTSLIQFERRQGIARRNGDLDEQSIRIDFEYTMPPYDFSMGIGSIYVALEFELFNEGQNGNGNNGNNGNGNNGECSDSGNNGNSGNTCNNGNTGDNGNGNNGGNGNGRGNGRN